MKKISILLVVCLVGLAGFSHAAGSNSFSVALETSDYGYREPHLPGPMRLSGMMYGVSARLVNYSLLKDFYNSENAFTALDVLYMTGKVDYDGYLQDSLGNIVAPFEQKNINDWYIDVRALSGRKFELAKDTWYLDLFAGLGYRFLRDEQQKKSDMGYLRESNYLYVPGGLNLSWKTSDTFKITATGEFDWLLEGTQKSDFGYMMLENRQTEGWGVRASLKLEKSLGAVAVFVEPFYRYWKIQNSDIDYGEIDMGGGWYTYQGGIEPFNITREYGLKVGLAF